MSDLWKAHTDTIRVLAKGLDDIPASEQFIGHFQMAMKDALLKIADELEALWRNKKAK